MSTSYSALISSQPVQAIIEALSVHSAVGDVTNGKLNSSATFLNILYIMELQLTPPAKFYIV